MIGRQVITVNRSFTLKELEQFMAQNWNKTEYNSFFIGKPTPASIDEYILLPATNRFMVIVYPKKAGGLFSKDNKVVLTVCDSPAGVRSRLITSIPTKNAFFGLFKISETLSTEKERKGPAEDVLQKYTAYMKQLLTNAGYAK